SQTLALSEEKSNLAARYWDRWSNTIGKQARQYKPNVPYCEKVQMVSPHLVKHNNLHWQVVHSMFNNASMTVYLYNAYYDHRMKQGPVVKLITTTDRQVDVEKEKWW